MITRFSVVFAFVFTVAVFVGVTPSYAVEATVDIKDMADTVAIKSTVETELQTNDTVTVITSGQEAYNSNGKDLKLLIPAGKKVIWKANYTGEVIESEALLFFAGGGSVEVTDCTVTNTGAGSVVFQGNGDLTVSGNTKISGNSVAVASNGDLTIESGDIRSEKGVGAVLCYGKFIMTGGTIYAGEGYAISGEGINSTITISGGFVFAHFATEVTATSAHGVASSEIDSAITQLSGTPKIEGTAAVAVWNTISGATEYVSGSADNLTVSPENSVVWWLENGVSGLRYNSSIFYPFDKVTITDPFEVQQATSGPAPDTNTNYVITISIIGGVIVLFVIFLVFWRLSRKRNKTKNADGVDDHNIGEV